MLLNSPQEKHFHGGLRTAASAAILCWTVPTFEQAVTLSRTEGSPGRASKIFWQSSFALSLASSLHRTCLKFSLSNCFSIDAAIFFLQTAKKAL